MAASVKDRNEKFFQEFQIFDINAPSKRRTSGAAGYACLIPASDT